jgi:hypothetical protein
MDLEVTSVTLADLSNVSSSQRLAAMRAGNPERMTPRDLRMVKGEFWQTRKVPAMAHHFTRGEFEAYLGAERFPSNTLLDRVHVHTASVRRALVTGLFVPQEVMQDVAGVEALGLAEMEVAAQAESAWKLAQQAEAVAVFERAIGYTVPYGVPRDALRKALLVAARGTLEPCSQGFEKWVSGGYKQIDLEGHPRGVLVALRMGVNGQQWLEMRDAGWHSASLYGAVHRMDYLDADCIYAEAILSGEVSLEQARSVMGCRWQPFMRVTAVTSSGVQGS